MWPYLIFTFSLSFKALKNLVSKVFLNNIRYLEPSKQQWNLRLGKKHPQVLFTQSSTVKSSVNLLPQGCAGVIWSVLTACNISKQPDNCHHIMIGAQKNMTSLQKSLISKLKRKWLSQSAFRAFSNEVMVVVHAGLLGWICLTVFETLQNVFTDFKAAL